MKLLATINVAPVLGYPIEHFHHMIRNRARTSSCHVGVQRSSMEYAVNLSSYAKNLSNDAMARCREKGVIGGLDPFGGCPGELCEEFPLVEASDLVAYLVLQTS